MFRSEKLVRITIQVPEPFISAVTGILARFKLLHLIRIDETHLGRLGYVAQTDGGLVLRYEDLSQEIERLMELLEVPHAGVDLAPAVIPEKDAYKIKEEIEVIRRQVDSALGALQGTQSSLAQKRALLDAFALLPDGLDFAQLSHCKMVRWTIGWVPDRDLERLDESLSRIHHAVFSAGVLEERQLIVVFGSKRDWAVFERALKGAFFDPLDIPDGLSGTAGEMLDEARREIGVLEQKELVLSRERARLCRELGTQLLVLRERVIAGHRILAARRYFGKIDKSWVISGWIPERLFTALGEEMGKATNGSAIYEKVEPEDLREVRKGIVRIPILFNNPMLISPFEKLTGLYGIPCYKEIEPTVLFALTFLLLFGMMFGDAGQGSVLFLTGYFLFRRAYRHTDYGIILMECGVSSILFGFLYGTVFGIDTILPALWFRPMAHIPYFVKVTLSLGVVMVSLGLVLNLINALRLKEYEALLSTSGLAGALLYWLSAGLLMKYLFTGRVAPGEMRILGWTAAALMTVMILHRPLYRVLIKRERPGRIIRERGLLSELMESVMELFDDLLRFVSNTVSFIRVAAFALAHAALFIAVFSVADLVSQEEGGGASYWLIVALGNIVIILLEGLVVSIQTVRLEYYEFFGNFFRGGGEKFRPFGGDAGSEDSGVQSRRGNLDEVP